MTGGVAEAAAPKADEPLRFAVIAAGLRFALERGEPFTAELAAAKAVGIDPATLEPADAYLVLFELGLLKAKDGRLVASKAGERALGRAE